jgi:hypothetical protein
MGAVQYALRCLIELSCGDNGDVDVMKAFSRRVNAFFMFDRETLPARERLDNSPKALVR